MICLVFTSQGRFMFNMKSYLRSKSRPVGPTTDGYIVEKCLTLVSCDLDVSEMRGFRGTLNQEERD